MSAFRTLRKDMHHKLKLALKNRKIDITKHKPKVIKYQQNFRGNYDSFTKDDLVDGVIYDIEFYEDNRYGIDGQISYEQEREETEDELAKRLINDHDDKKAKEKYKKSKLENEIKEYKRLKKKLKNEPGIL